MHTRDEKLKAFDKVLDVLETLRVKCPWDRKQTNESLRPNTIEETFELADALIADDNANICKELGDVLLHVVFYSKIGEEKGAFDLADVCTKLTDKLIYRHPHIYGTVKADTAEEVTSNWEKLKQTEKDGNKSVLGGVPKALPAMIKAERIQEKAANVGFDWKERSDVWQKVKEEVTEVQQEIDNKDKNRLEREFGDLMFAIINAARLYGVNPENALEHTNRKFIDRFNYIESGAVATGRKVSELSLEEMDALWDEHKKQEREK